MWSDPGAIFTARGDENIKDCAENDETAQDEEDAISVQRSCVQFSTCLNKL